MKKVTFISCILLAALAVQPAFADTNLNPFKAEQKTKTLGFPANAYNRWSVGIQAGLTTLQSDANKISPSWAAGLNVKYSFGHTLSLRIVGNYGNLKGARKDDIPELTDFSSSNNFIEASAQAVITLGNISFLTRQRKTNLYTYLGFGIINSNPKFKYTNTNTGVVTDSSLKETAMIIPFGLGLNFNLSPKLDLAVEYGGRIALSDWIDGLNFRSSSNRSNTDLYSVVSVGLNFKLGKNDKHVDWVNPVATIYDQLDTMQSRVDKLSTDGDGDGVADFWDKDPQTPKDAKVYGNGEAVDTDGDKVPDFKDEEPYSPKGAAVDEKGKSIDTDNDGVADVNDLSPNTDSSLMVNFQGIPMMTKQLARELASGGNVGGVGYMPAIMFSTGSAKISGKTLTDLNNIANMLSNNKSLKLTIIGNADERGSNKFNEKLAMKRAEAVKKALIDMGVDASRLSTGTNGETTPIAKGHNENAWSANRRVQFFLSK